MADSTWKYVENQFDNSTKESKKRMKQIAKKHRDALNKSSLPNKAVLLARLDAELAPFTETYETWLDNIAWRKGAVIVYDAAIEKLSALDIEDIDVAFKQVYKRSTPEYGQVFSKGREPFQSGAADERVDALERLHEQIGTLNNQATQPVQALINGVLQPLVAARGAVNGFESQAEVARTRIEPLRVKVAGALYANLGSLMETHASNPEEVTAYFDLGLLRQTSADEEEPAPVTPPTASVPTP